MDKKSISMKAIIVVSFVVFLISVLVICFTLFFYWQASAEDMIKKVESNIRKDILSKIEVLADVPLYINEVNHRLLTGKVIDINNADEREKFFTGVIKSHSGEVYSISFGTAKGEYYGARRNERNEIEIMKNNSETNGHSWYYSVNEDMTSGKLALDAGKFDVRTREWYKIAIKTKGPCFSQAYKHFVMDDLAISAVCPVYDDEGSLVGVLGTHITLSKMNSYLKEISLENNSIAYIIEEGTGELVANSMDLPNFKTLENNEVKRISVQEVQNEYLAAAYRNYKNNSISSFTYNTNNDRLHLNVTRYKNKGLNWLIISAVPESQFTSEITKGLGISIFISVIAIVFSILVYIKITQIVTALEKKLKERTGELEKANQAKRDFLAMMSHEVRTPMNGIIGFIQFLEETALTAEQLKLLNNAKESAETLLAVTNEILDFSKIEAGKLELEAIGFDIWAVTESVVFSYAKRVDEKGLRLNLKIAPDVPRYVAGDPTKLKQVIGNLMSNAVKFTETGGISAEVSVGQQDAQNAELIFTVRDTGIGMSEQELSRIFEPFTQADLSSTRKYGGTGLGLSICKRIIEMMGGEIKVTSKKGEGSRFVFTIVVNKAEGSEFQKPDYSSAVENIDNRVPAKEACVQPKILLAEDNDINRQLLIKLLKTKGLDCEVVTNGEEAVKACAGSQYDMILMDCRMPVMDGYEAARRIRENEGNQKHTVIVAMTANAMKGDKEKCLEAGMDAYLSKPVNFEQVMEILQRYCGAKDFSRDAGITSENSDERITNFDTSLDKLLSELIHDIRSPLSSVASMLELLDEEYYDEENKEIIQEIRKQVTKAFLRLERIENQVI